jgi:solute carrier family 25 (mitochondrial carnitine/acylcarnitine transporter), member 20/29
MRFACEQWLPPFYCIDVVKSRMQSAEPGVYSNAWNCVVKSYRAEGGMVFFRGLGTAILRAFPLHATVFFVYETTITMLKAS